MADRVVSVLEDLPLELGRDSAISASLVTPCDWKSEAISRGSDPRHGLV